MLLFDKSNFNEVDVNYLSFDNDFKIEINKDKIKTILGPNGIGKSSIYRNIQLRHPEYSYIDYNKVEEAMLKNKDNLVIASKVATIEAKEKEMQSIIDTINLKSIFKDFDLGSKQKCEKISQNLNNYRNDFDKAINKFSGNKLEPLFELDDDLKGFIVKYGKTLINQTIEEAKIEEIKDSYKKKCLEIIDKYLNDDEYVCPVCGSECDEPIKDIIKRSISKINETTNNIVKDYISNNPQVSPTNVLEKVNKLKYTITQNAIDIEILEDYIICGGNKEKAEFIIKNKEKINDLKSEISTLQIEKMRFYTNIKSIETRIREIFERQLGIPTDNIIFDDTNKELRITLSRDITKYSTGEINLITFIVTMLEFISSDRDTVIIDDPLSSYDIPNQYRIMYEITKANYGKDCYVLILTHNIDCINIAHSQYSNSYDIELMDKINGSLYLNTLDELGDKGFNIEYITSNLTNRTDYNYTEYICLLSEKDSWLKNDPRHQLFHFDSPYSIPNSTCNNTELVNIIDTFDDETTNIANIDSVVNSSNKILYLAALRVWIEKQFYDNTDDKNGLIKQNFLGDKIKFMLDNNHWTGKAQIKKDFLMSKKVMLNQNEHAESQKEPFYYALSISTDDILNDIVEIKKHFSN